MPALQTTPERETDVVWTWVDGRWPGFAESLAEHAREPLHQNPNRYRDDLETLRYGLRSLERHVPSVRDVVLVTARPQVPRWLDPERVRIVHHDDVFAPHELPTFNSFALVSMLARIPGLSPQFLYMEDDRLFLADVTKADFVDAQGRTRLYAHGESTPRGDRRTRESSPWERALAESNHALDAVHGPADRPTLKRAPLWVDTAWFEDCRRTFSAAFERTIASRFRDPGCVAPEHLYPYHLLHTGRAVFAPKEEVRSVTGYVGLERWALWNALQLARIGRRQPRFVTLNDNFGPAPAPRALEVVRRWLDEQFPTPSRYER